MFEDSDACAAMAAWWSRPPDEPDWDIRPMPEPPEDMLEHRGPTQEDLDWLQHQLTMMTPAERFREEFGLSAVPEQYSIEADAAERAATLRQDLAVQANRVHTIAEAHRITALLQAYETSLEDLEVRFGRGTGTRGGPGAQAFFKSMGLLTLVHPFRVAHEVDTALVLRDRLPLTWATFQRGEASWSRVDAVVRSADGLDAEHWPPFDEQAATAAARSTRLRDELRKTRERLQDDTAAARARTTHQRRRTIVEPCSDGGASFVVEGLATDWVPVADALHRAAVAAHGVEGETRTVAMLRHDIALDVMHEGLRRFADAGAEVRVPHRKPVEVTLVLTVPALAWLGRSLEQARLDGYGPIDLETAKALAGSARSFIRVLTDPVTGVRLAMDRTTYAPPADLARWVRIRDGRSRFPGSNRPAHLADIDHAREWQHGGTTDAANLVTLDRTNHNLKSAGLFQEQLRDDGFVTWTDAWGRRFDDPPADPLDPAPGALLSPPAGPPEPDASCPF